MGGMASQITSLSIVYTHTPLESFTVCVQCKSKQICMMMILKGSSMPKVEHDLRVIMYPAYGTHTVASIRPVSQAACHEPAGSYDKTTRTAICFEPKTQYLLIRAPFTRIVVFWHISNIPPMISQSQISCSTSTFYIATFFVKYCYTTGSWLL